MKLVQVIKATRAAHLCGVDLKLYSPGGRVAVALHTHTDDGLGPDIATTAIEPGDITPGQWARAQWPLAEIQAGQQIAISITTADPTTAAGIATIGQKDPASGTYVTAPALELGDLYLLDDTGTITTQPGACLTMQMLSAEYTEATRTVPVATVPVVDATDLAILAGIARPEAGARATFTLALDDGRSFTVDNAQRIELGAHYTGNVVISVNLARGPSLAPVIEQGTTLLVGSVSPTAVYITNAFNMAGGDRLNVTFDAHLPSGSGVAIDYQPTTADPVAGAWLPVPYLDNSGATAGFITITHEAAAVGAPAVRLRVTSTGTPAARPLVTNLRAVAL